MRVATRSDTSGTYNMQLTNTSAGRQNAYRRVAGSVQSVVAGEGPTSIQPPPFHILLSERNPSPAGWLVNDCSGSRLALSLVQLTVLQKHIGEVEFWH